MAQFRLIVAGSRGFKSYRLLEAKLDTLLSAKRASGDEIVIISGCANGADQMGERYAKSRKLKVVLMPADWDGIGASAGYKRNVEMAKVADGLVAFWDGQSPGTKHMIEEAKRRGLGVRVIEGGF